MKTILNGLDLLNHAAHIRAVLGDMRRLWRVSAHYAQHEDTLSGITIGKIILYDKI